MTAPTLGRDAKRTWSRDRRTAGTSRAQNQIIGRPLGRRFFGRRAVPWSAIAGPCKLACGRRWLGAWGVTMRPPHAAPALVPLFHGVGALPVRAPALESYNCFGRKARYLLDQDPMTKRIQPRPVTSSSWNIYLAQHSPAKWIGTVEAVDKDAAIEKAAELFKANDPRKMIAVQRR
jgi:hypothetical protein